MSSLEPSMRLPHEINVFTQDEIFYTLAPAARGGATTSGVLVFPLLLPCLLLPLTHIPTHTHSLSIYLSPSQ